MKKIVVLFLAVSLSCFGQEDEKKIKEIFDAAMTQSSSYDWLNHLSNQIGGRLSGSVQAEEAVQYTYKELKKLAIDRAYLEPVMVPKWVRGTPEFAYVETSPGNTFNVPICALGGSIATPALGLKAEIVEVMGIDGLKEVGRANIEGKIVFFNEPMDQTFVQTLQAYGKAGKQRVNGAAEAAKYGAVGVIVRSLSTRLDDYPHTGSMHYSADPSVRRIPAAAISTNGAELLSKTLELNPKIKFFFKQSCRTMPDVQSYNVVAEIKGSEYPDEIIVVGGHLDSWDLGDGSHDDGAGCVQSMGVIELFNKIGYKPKRTIRAVMFMNEENGLRGGTKYAENAKKNKEHHIFGLESDLGGFTPRGFTFSASDQQFATIESWKHLFEPYLVNTFFRGGGGADIGPLKGVDASTVLSGLRPDPQRYFDHHHAANDTFEHVNKRELHLGLGAMASLIYLVDQNGF
jgi:hypothetical protein